MPPATSMVTVPSLATDVFWRTAYTMRDTLPASVLPVSEPLPEQPGRNASAASSDNAPGAWVSERSAPSTDSCIERGGGAWYSGSGERTVEYTKRAMPAAITSSAIRQPK